MTKARRVRVNRIMIIAVLILTMIGTAVGFYHMGISSMTPQEITVTHDGKAVIQMESGHIYEYAPEMYLDTENKQIMTVDDVVSKAGTDYFIVKDINSWGILEPDVYMDREVVEINICDDTPDTLCLFIELEENEEPHFRKTSEN